MCVAGGRLDLAMAQELANHRKAFTQGESPGRGRVAEVLDTNVLSAQFWQVMEGHGCERMRMALVDTNIL